MCCYAILCVIKSSDGANKTGNQSNKAYLENWSWAFFFQGKTKANESFLAALEFSNEENDTFRRP